MSLSNEHRITAWPEALLRVLRADPWVGWGLLTGLCLALPAALITASAAPEPGAWRWVHVIPLGLSMLAVVAVVACLKRSPYASERRFWSLVLPAQSSFFFAQVLLSFSGSGKGPYGPTEWGANLSLGLYFALMITAIELRPDRQRSADASRLDTLWVQPAAVLFVASLWLYFPGISLWRGSPQAELEGQTLLLFSTFAAFLAGRCLLFGLESGILRWRLQYSVLVGAFAVILVGSWIPALGFGDAILWKSFAAAISSWLLIIAAGFNRLPFSGSSSRKTTSAVALDLSSAHRSTTLLWTLALPSLHVLLHRLGMLPDANRNPRELLVLLAVVVLGAYAIAQRYWVEMETVGLWQKQRSMADELQCSEHDLRILVERNRGLRELEQSEKKFSIAFRLSPDGMMISTVQGDRIVDVNHSFCAFFDTEPETLIGQPTKSFKFWPEPGFRDSVLREVMTRGNIRDMLWKVDNPDDTGFSPDGTSSSPDGITTPTNHMLAVSFELIHTGNETLLLTIARDASDRGSSPHSDIELLNPTSTAIFATDSENQLSFWSPAAAELYGWEEEDTLGYQPVELNLPVPSTTQAGSAASKPIFRGRSSTQDGLPLRLTCHVAALEDEEAQPSGHLTFTTPSRRRSVLERPRSTPS